MVLTSLVNNNKKNEQKTELCVDYWAITLEISIIAHHFEQKRLLHNFYPHTTPYFAQNYLIP